MRDGHISYTPLDQLTIPDDPNELAADIRRRNGGLAPGRDDDAIKQYSSDILSGAIPQDKVDALIARNPSAAPHFQKVWNMRKQFDIYQKGQPEETYGVGAGPLASGYVPLEQAQSVTQPAVQSGDIGRLQQSLIGMGPEGLDIARKLGFGSGGGRAASAPTNLIAMRSKGIQTGNPTIDAMDPKQASEVLGAIQTPINVGDETGSFYIPRPEAVGGRFTKMKRLPPSINKGINENIAAARMLDGLVKATEKNPKAFGAKTILPDVLLQMADKQGVDLRADVANIGSLKIHDRSGAAVAAQEFPRLRPFIPSAGDSPQTVVTKLKGFQRELRRTLEETAAGFGPGQGYVPHEGLKKYLSRKPEENDPLGIRQ